MSVRPPASTGKARQPATLKEALAMKPKRNKFGAKKTWCDGMLFDSKREASCWPNLKSLRERGVIINLERQKSYALVVEGVHIATYRSDFEWDEEVKASSTFTRHVVADAKGFKTREYKIKKALMKAIYGIEIREL